MAIRCVEEKEALLRRQNPVGEREKETHTAKHATYHSHETKADFIV